MILHTDSNYDNRYSPPRTTGKGKIGNILVKFPNIPYIACYTFVVGQTFAGGKFGPTELDGGGEPFNFDGFVNEK